MIKTNAVVALAPIAVGGPVLAVGLTPTETVPTQVAEPESSRFRDAYLGASLGFSWQGADVMGVSGSGISGAEDIGDLGGTTFGLQAGDRWDPKPAILEVELSGGVGNVSAEFDGSKDGGESTQDHAIAPRGALGCVARTDTMFHGFAGASTGQFDYKVERIVGGEFDDGFIRTRYLGGIGVERAFGDKWSLRGENPYTRSGKEDPAASNGFDTEAALDDHILSLGLNYRFGR